MSKAELFREIAKLVGETCATKNAAYGDSFSKSGAILALLYPDGIKPAQYGKALAVTRIIDKLFRIANQPDAFGESPGLDIAGYGVLMAADDPIPYRLTPQAAPEAPEAPEAGCPTSLPTPPKVPTVKEGAERYAPPPPTTEDSNYRVIVEVNRKIDATRYFEDRSEAILYADSFKASNYNKGVTVQLQLWRKTNEFSSSVTWMLLESWNIRGES